MALSPEQAAVVDELLGTEIESHDTHVLIQEMLKDVAEPTALIKFLRNKASQYRVKRDYYRVHGTEAEAEEFNQKAYVYRQIALRLELSI